MSRNFTAECFCGPFSRKLKNEKVIRVILTILAVIFAFAAGGKLWLVATDPFADIKLGYPVVVLWLAIAVESGLVYLNVRAILPASHPHPPPRSFPFSPIAWLANLGFLVVLLVTSLVRWALGYVSCGCFGAFELPAWATPLFNSVAIVSLVVLRPGKTVLRASLVELGSRAGIMRGVGLDDRQWVERRAFFVGSL